MHHRPLVSIFAEESRQHVKGSNELPKLVQLMTDAEDEEFVKTIKYLLQLCVSSKYKRRKLLMWNCNVFCLFCIGQFNI